MPCAVLTQWVTEPDGLFLTQALPELSTAITAVGDGRPEDALIDLLAALSHLGPVTAARALQ